jgi:endonuclease-3
MPAAAPDDTLLTPAEIDALFAKLAAVEPEPKSELAYSDPYTLLVAVVLSAQATDVSVNAATEKLFRVASTPEAMVALGEDGLRAHIRTIGLFNTKAKNIIALSKALLERHGGQVPRDRAALEALPGVGRKSANVVLNVAFGEPTIAVDTHCFRVANRTGLAAGKTVGEVERQLEARIPARWRQRAHHWLILHGRYVCKARKPRCDVCPIREICRHVAKTASEQPAAADETKARGHSRRR